ncbi:MAG: M48 family metallopeptidase [Candidatus Micrarchaeota archaeon]
MEIIEISGKRFVIERLLCKNKNATAKLRNEKIIINIPSRWPLSEREKISADLLKRAVNSIENGRWNVNAGKKIEFSHGQRLIVLGKEFEISFVQSERFGVKIVGRKVEVKINDHPDKNQIVAKLIRKKIGAILMPELTQRVSELNEKHFKSEISCIKIRDAVSRWGSCTTTGVISLNFRLLLMPPDILDYVIVHELAHTKYRSHGPRFWNLVGDVIPDHKLRRSWLRKNGWSSNNLTTVEPLEEPY